jgi:hypothetical protein
MAAIATGEEKDSQQHQIPAKGVIPLAERHHVDERGQASQPSNDLGVDPSRVGSLVCLGRTVKVDAIETADSDCQDKLEEADEGDEDARDERWVVLRDALPEGHF